MYSKVIKKAVLVSLIMVVCLTCLYMTENVRSENIDDKMSTSTTSFATRKHLTVPSPTYSTVPAKYVSSEESSDSSDSYSTIPVVEVITDENSYEEDEEYFSEVSKLSDDTDINEDISEEMPEVSESYETEQLVVGGEEELDYSVNESTPNYNYVGTWTVTFYCNCEICCGVWAGGATASGTYPTPWYTVASDLPFGTRIYIDGLGEFVVEDRGVEGEWVDIFVNNHEEALSLGQQYRDVYIIE